MSDKKEKVSPFVWVDNLCLKQDDMIEAHGEEAYPAFMINRAMSQYPDCVFPANEMNMYPDLSPRMAYDYYYHGIRKAKRFAKWGKKKAADEAAQAIMVHYQVNRERAEEYLRVLTEEQVDYIQELENAE